MVLIRFSSAAACQSSTLVSAKLFDGGPPALATQMSRRPNCAAVAGTKARTCSYTVTSTARVNTSTPVSRRISSAVASSVDWVRAHSASFAPSRARPSATALPSPVLDAATSATRSFSPRSIWLFPQVGVVFGQPVVPDGAEDVEIEGVFQRHRGVRYVRRDAQHLAGGHHDRLAFDRKSPRAFQNVSDLFALMMVLRNHRSLGQENLGNHGLFARNHLAPDGGPDCATRSSSMPRHHCGLCLSANGPSYSAFLKIARTLGLRKSPVAI